jgi:hypothetical protein
MGTQRLVGAYLLWWHAPPPRNRPRPAAPPDNFIFGRTNLRFGYANTKLYLWDYVEKLSRHEGMTIFFTTHYLDEAEHVADRIAIIDHGKIITTGTVAELTKQTKTKTLEQAYLQLTGKDVRDKESKENNGLNMRTGLRNSRLR